LPVPIAATEPAAVKSIPFRLLSIVNLAVFSSPTIPAYPCPLVGAWIVFPQIVINIAELIYTTKKPKHA
jgi:hypothetical protein